MNCSTRPCVHGDDRSCWWDQSIDCFAPLVEFVDRKLKYMSRFNKEKSNDENKKLKSKTGHRVKRSVSDGPGWSPSI